ncbi:hypothetical protein EC9_02550 [Rosistilla ulvae]|uniref:Uncharacterized protein n=1 Tax=Rosistilla ulvae TaxID=1930277 RepID=A0A517LU02_9BACT|nr:hypothetical protein EC9_02550 [Rosistilla ulvae]
MRDSSWCGKQGEHLLRNAETYHGLATRHSGRYPETGTQLFREVSGPHPRAYHTKGRSMFSACFQGVLPSPSGRIINTLAPIPAGLDFPRKVTLSPFLKIKFAQELNLTPPPPSWQKKTSAGAAVDGCSRHTSLAIFPAAQLLLFKTLLLVTNSQHRAHHDVQQRDACHAANRSDALQTLYAIPQARCEMLQQRKLRAREPGAGFC